MTYLTVPSISAKMVRNANFLSAARELDAMVIPAVGDLDTMVANCISTDPLIHIICILTFITQLIQT